MSKSTPWFRATGPPTVDRTGPMTGWLFHVMVFSPQLQLLTAWICPPELLFEPLAAATCRCSVADATVRGLTPLTLMRTNVRLIGLASAVSTLLVPAFVVGLAKLTKASAITVATGHGRLAGVFTQPVAGLQESVVQAVPSLQGAVFGAPPAQAPAPSHVEPEMQMLLAQACPAGSNWQSGEQQSPATMLPSSHSSPRSSTPFPQMWAILPMIVPNSGLCSPPAGNPGPLTRTKFWPQADPVTVWSAAGLPTRPGSGAGATAVRKGPTRPVARAGLKATPGPAADTGTRALSCVKLTVPRVSARSTSTPYGWLTVYVPPGVAPRIRTRMRPKTTWSPATAWTPFRNDPSSAAVYVTLIVPDVILLIARE